jgi:hypothetical protein
VSPPEMVNTPRCFDQTQDRLQAKQDSSLPPFGYTQDKLQWESRFEKTGFPFSLE